MTTTELPLPAVEALAPPRSMADAPLPAYESHSSISTYRACPLRYGFRYVERRPGDISPGQFAFGSAVHKAFEAFGLARICARAEGTPEKYGVQAFPTLNLIDPEGKVRDVQMGYSPTLKADLTKAIEGLLPPK